MSNRLGFRGQRKTLTGLVVSNAMNKTIVVQVTRVFKHPRYEKIVQVRKKFYAHDETNDAQPGDTVLIAETRPLSRLKRWRLRQVVERAK